VLHSNRGKWKPTTTTPAKGVDSWSLSPSVDVIIYPASGDLSKLGELKSSLTDQFVDTDQAKKTDEAIKAEIAAINWKSLGASRISESLEKIVSWFNAKDGKDGKVVSQQTGARKLFAHVVTNLINIRSLSAQEENKYTGASSILEINLPGIKAVIDDFLGPPSGHPGQHENRSLPSIRLLENLVTLGRQIYKNKLWGELFFHVRRAGYDVKRADQTDWVTAAAKWSTLKKVKTWIFKKW